MQTSEVLYTAADLIEKRGWAVGNCGMAAVGPMCLEGAIAGAMRLPVESNTARPLTGSDLPVGALIYGYTNMLHNSPAYRAVQAHLDGPFEIWEWNDEDERTAAEVIEVLRATAVIEAAKEQAASDLADALDVAPVGVRA